MTRSSDPGPSDDGGVCGLLRLGLFALIVGRKSTGFSQETENASVGVVWCGSCCPATVRSSSFVSSSFRSSMVCTPQTPNHTTAPIVFF